MVLVGLRRLVYPVNFLSVVLRPTVFLTSTGRESEDGRCV